MLKPLTGMGDAARPERAVDPAGVEARSRAVNGVDAPAPETLESGPEQTPLSSNALRLELVSAPPPEDPLKPAPPPPVSRALSPRSLLMLQRSFGNAAVAELVRRTASPPSPPLGEGRVGVQPPPRISPRQRPHPDPPPQAGEGDLPQPDPPRRMRRPVRVRRRPSRRPPLWGRE